MVCQRDVDVRSLNVLYVTGEDRVRTLIEAATAYSCYRTCVADHARSRDRHDNISCPTDHGIIPKDRDEPLDAINAILKCNHTSVGAYERACLLTRRLGIPQFYGEEHHVDWSDLLRVIGDIDVLQMKIAKGTLYLEAISTNCIAMRAARNERHIMSSRG